MSKDEPLISVIVPIYNVESYLEKCMRSICNQNYKNLQIILVNDGSTDKSLDICRNFKKEDSRICVIDKKNGGLISARKCGMKYAIGEYVSFVDGDDWIDLDMYECLVQQACIYGYPDIISFGHIEEYESFANRIKNNFPEGLYDTASKDFQVSDAIMTDIFFQWKILPNLANKLIRFDIVSSEMEKVPENIVFGEDAVCTYLCIRKSRTFLNIDYCPYHYRQREGSIVKTREEQDSENFKEIYRALKNVVCSRHLHQYLFFILLLKGYTKIDNKRLLFPFDSVHLGDRIFLYGAGGFGKVLHDYILQRDGLTLVGWTDRKYMVYRKSLYDIDEYDSIFTKKYDYIIISILNEKICEAIREDLIKKGIPQNKILFISFSLIEMQKLPEWLKE